MGLMQPLEASWTSRAVLSFVVILLGILVWVLVKFVIRRFVKYTIDHTKKRTDGSSLLQRAGLTSERQLQRTRTVGSLLSSISTFVIALITALTVMSILGIPMAPLLASAGIGGVAVGLGAQSLIKDSIAGLFMMLEDQYGVGDVIEVGDVKGTVDEVTLRITRLQDSAGKVWYLRNGEVTELANISQGYSRAQIDVPVSYSEDPGPVAKLITKVGHEMASDPDWKNRLLEDPEVQGVQSLEGAAMTMHVVAKCAPNQDKKVKRELLERIKKALDAAHVEGPTAV